MLVTIFAAAIEGINSNLIRVEVKITQGIKYFLVGLPDNAIKEGYYRIESALNECNFKIPRKKIIVNLAPANIKKVGSSYDLSIAIGILISDKQIKVDNISDYLIMGELSLDGSIMPIKGALSIIIMAKKIGIKNVIIPEKNLNECSIINGINIYGAKKLSQVIDFFKKKTDLKKSQYTRPIRKNIIYPDLLDVRGQFQAKRAMTISAAGSHNLLMIGSPGVGKSMLSKRFPGILPKMNERESIETTRVFSVAGKLDSQNQLISERPFRAPHHTISDIALFGGGQTPMPGEISLSNNGVLFLDELLEFKKSVLQVLRQPLEEGKVNISRAKYQLEYPAKFILISAMNPCPCGFLGHPKKKCTCTNTMIKKYQQKLSGPLLDRIDIQIHIPPVDLYKDFHQKDNLSSNDILQKVSNARTIQKDRFKNISINYNSEMENKEIRDFCIINDKDQEWLNNILSKLNYSARSYIKILKLSRTIADLGLSDNISREHISEAIHLRQLDRNIFLS